MIKLDEKEWESVAVWLDGKTVEKHSSKREALQHCNHLESEGNSSGQFPISTRVRETEAHTPNVIGEHFLKSDCAEWEEFMARAKLTGTREDHAYREIDLRTVAAWAYRSAVEATEERASVAEARNAATLAAFHSASSNASKLELALFRQAENYEARCEKLLAERGEARRIASAYREAWEKCSAAVDLCPNYDPLPWTIAEPEPNTVE